MLRTQMSNSDLFEVYFLKIHPNYLRIDMMIKSLMMFDYQLVSGLQST